MKKTFTKCRWTNEEDKLLKAYVKKHGDRTWSDVQKQSGLSRCAKSCRFRWMNHLRPELKTGAFTEKEEQRIIELHAILGNKWAQIARELHGRTDNEIKNFWNVRLKRLQRLGLPVYPDEVREHAMNASASQSGLNIDLLDGHHSQDSLKADNVEIPQVESKHLPLNQYSPYYQSMLANVPTTVGFMRQRPSVVQPDRYNLITSPHMPSLKRFREPETTGGYAMNKQNPTLSNYPFVESTQEQLPDSHFLGNATYSSPPGPLIHGLEKLELPSFQGFNTHEELSSCGAEQYNPMPNLEPHNTLVQSPLIDQTPLYDGMLESIVYGSLGERPNSDTSSESPLFQSSLLSHTEVTPASANTIDLDYLGSTSSNERHTSNDGDWIRQFLGEDTYNTKKN